MTILLHRSLYMKLLKKYATYIELIQKKSQDSEILTKHFNFNHSDKYWIQLPGLISPAAVSLVAII